VKRHGGLYADDLVEQTYHGKEGVAWFFVGAAIFVLALAGFATAVGHLESLAVRYLPTSNPIDRGTVSAIFLQLLTVVILYLVWVERKFLARVVVRYGPSRWGKFGLLTPIADSLKLMGKEDTMPRKADRWVFRAAPVVTLAPGLMIFAVVPWTSTLIPSHMDIGILYIFALSSLVPIGGLMAGWGPNNKYNMLGGLRYGAQMIAYEIPLVLSTLGVVAMVRSFSGVAIAEAQSGYWFGIIPSWFVFIQPLAFFVFLIAFLAESGRTPFDQMEDEHFLGSGWITEYSGMKFAIFLLAEYLHMFAGSALLVILFLGGWSGPAIFPPLFWMLLKVILVILFTMWVRGTHFRTRIDQLVAIGWKILIPLALLNIGLTSIVITI